MSPLRTSLNVRSWHIGEAGLAPKECPLSAMRDGADLTAEKQTFPTSALAETDTEAEHAEGLIGVKRRLLARHRHLRLVTAGPATKTASEDPRSIAAPAFKSRTIAGDRTRASTTRTEETSMSNTHQNTPKADLAPSNGSCAAKGTCVCGPDCKCGDDCRCSTETNCTTN